MRVSTCLLSSLCLCASVVHSPAADPGPWATYRGNSQRTGNTDGRPGPEKPGVLWVVKSQDHFVAAPVPVGGNVYLSALGAFNRPTAALYPLTGGPRPVVRRHACSEESRTSSPL